GIAERYLQPAARAILDVDSALVAECLREPGEPRQALVGQLEKRSAVEGFAERAEHSSRSPRSATPRGIALDDDDGRALPGKLAGDGTADRSAADHHDISRVALHAGESRRGSAERPRVSREVSASADREERWGGSASSGSPMPS